MTQKYVLDRAPEIDRLEKQADLIGLDRVRDHLQVSEGQSVLDAGSGSGWVSRLIAREAPGATVTGVDITQSFVDFARQTAADEGLTNLEHLHADICDLPFEDDRFDLVWSQLVLFFLPHPEKAIAEFARVTRPGGQVKVVVTDGSFEQLWPPRPDLSEGIRNMRDKVLHGWRLARIPRMLDAAGLTQITSDVAVDRVYSFTGGASPAQRLNIEESFVHAIRSQHAISGGQAQADRLADDLLAFVDDPASVALSTHWTFSAVKP